MGKGSSGKKPHYAQDKKREKWKKDHPGWTRKSWAKKKRQERLAKK